MSASLALLLTQIIAGIVGAAVIGIGALAVAGFVISWRQARDYRESEE